MEKMIKSSVLFVLIFSLMACAGQTYIKKRDLDVQTKMSDTIFLEPVSPNERIIFVDIRNTSDKDLDIDNRIVAMFMKNGFQITQDPAKANFMLQANVLQVEKTDLREASTAFAGGYGGALLGSHIGGNSTDGAIVGGAIGFLADALVEDIHYIMITDVQVRERPLAGEKIVQTQNTSASQGTSTSLNQSASGGKVKWKTYRTRIVSTANKVNLEFAEAKNALEEGLVRSLAGVF